MAKVKAKQDCFVGNVFRKEGEVFEHEGKLEHFLEQHEKPSKGKQEAKAAVAAEPSKDASPQGKEAI